MGLADSGVKQTYASRQALRMAEKYNLRLTSGYRSPSHDKKVGGTGSGDHVDGEAYDFAGTWNNMLKFAKWAHESGMFTQVIFQDKDYRTGRRIGGHMNHVHVAWNGNESLYGPPEAPLLKKFDASQLIKTVQQLLGNLKIDGYYGPKTEKAVKEFQKDQGIQIDGITGPETWEKLTKGGHSFFS